MKDHELAMRYSSALFQKAQAAGQLDEVGAALRLVLDSVVAEKALMAFFQSPLHAPLEKQRVLASAAPGKLPKLLLDFLMVVITRCRFGQLETIVECYQELLDASRNLAEVTITTARPLGPAVLQKLTLVLEKKLGQKVVSTTRVEPSLIGGIKVQVRQRLIDCSVRTKLDDLWKQMSGLN